MRKVSVFTPVCTNLREGGCIVVYLSAWVCRGVLQKGREGRAVVGLCLRVHV